MKKILNFKKLSCYVAALVLSLTAALIIVPNDVNAACDGPKNINELERVIRNNAPGLFDQSASVSITLCGDIIGELDAYSDFNKRYNITLDLNGYKIKKASGNAIIVSSNAYLTINDTAGGGEVIGGFNANTSRLTITGGSYTRSPANYIKDSSLTAYKVGTVWKVETKLTEDNVKVSPASIVIRVGDTETIEASKPAGSTTGFTFETDGNVVSVDTDGVVTGVSVGTAEVTVTPTYDTNIVKTVDVEVLPVLSSISAKDVVTRVGETVTIVKPTVEDSSIVGATFTYASDDEGIATVDSEGVVTGVSAGTVDITITASYTDILGEMTASTIITASVYDVQAGELDDDEVAANTVRDLLDEGLPEEMSEASDTIKEAFGNDFEATGDSLKSSMQSGSVITTRVNIADATDTDAMAKIDEALADIDITDIKYYDVTVVMEENGNTIGLLHKLNDVLTVAIAEVEDPESGYERQYYVVAYHEGDEAATILSEGSEYEIKDGKIYIISDRFSTFAVAYEDTPIEEEPAEEEPAEEEPAEEEPAEEEPAEEEPAEEEPAEEEPAEEEPAEEEPAEEEPAEEEPVEEDIKSPDTGRFVRAIKKGEESVETNSIVGLGAIIIAFIIVLFGLKSKEGHRLTK